MDSQSLAIICLAVANAATLAVTYFAYRKAEQTSK